MKSQSFFSVLHQTYYHRVISLLTVTVFGTFERAILAVLLVVSGVLDVRFVSVVLTSFGESILDEIDK